MELKDKIKHLRELKGLTLEQVGNAVGVGKSTVRKWETGDIANMRRDKIDKLASALHTTPAYLMGWEEYPDGQRRGFMSNTFLDENGKADEMALRVFFDAMAHCYVNFHMMPHEYLKRWSQGDEQMREYIRALRPIYRDALLTMARLTEEADSDAL